MTNPTLQELLAATNAHTHQKTASESLNVVEHMTKQANEAGIAQGEQFVKMASFAGDIMGEQSAFAFKEKIASELGFSSEDCSRYSLGEMFGACLMKIAENVQGNEASKIQAQVGVEAAQASSAATHNAVMAIK